MAGDCRAVKLVVPSFAARRAHAPELGPVQQHDPRRGVLVRPDSPPPRAECEEAVVGERPQGLRHLGAKRMEPLK